MRCSLLSRSGMKKSFLQFFSMESHLAEKPRLNFPKHQATLKVHVPMLRMFPSPYMYSYTHTHTHAGDSEKNEKVALILLCKVLPKRTVINPLLYIYEECLVCILYCSTCPDCKMCMMFFIAHSKLMTQWKLLPGYQLDPHQDLPASLVKSHSILFLLRRKCSVYVIHFLML